MKEDETGRTYSTNGEEEHMYVINGNTGRAETTRKTKKYVGG
jgi:hypothetical protein